MRNSASRILCALMLSYITSHSAYAQEIVKLWENGAPQSKECAEYQETIVYADKEKQKPRVAQVTDPTMTVYRPTGDVPSKRTAIILCPGGSYTRLCIDDEGHKVAQEMAANGITAFVLKYRLPDDRIMEAKQFGPLSDAQRAIRIVRAHAADYGVDVNKIGICGFSAGGNLASTTSTLFDVKAYDPGSDTTSARPDFSILAYSVISLREGIAHKLTRKSLTGDNDEIAAQFSADEHIGPNTPPAFIFQATDDKAVNPLSSISYFSELRKHNIPAELHIFSKGGHGFGLGTGRRTENWLPLFLTWYDELLITGMPH